VRVSGARAQKTMFFLSYRSRMLASFFWLICFWRKVRLK